MRNSVMVRCGRSNFLPSYFALSRLTVLVVPVVQLLPVLLVVPVVLVVLLLLILVLVHYSTSHQCYNVLVLVLVVVLLPLLPVVLVLLHTGTTTSCTTSTTYCGTSTMYYIVSTYFCDDHHSPRCERIIPFPSTFVYCYQIFCNSSKLHKHGKYICM